MTEKNKAKRAERIATNKRNMDRIIMLFLYGCLAEFYLLTVSRFYIGHGTITQILSTDIFLQVMLYIGLALFVAGLILFSLPRKKKSCGKAGAYLIAFGGFFAITSTAMRHGHTKLMCVLVPVLMLMSIVYFIYPREFFFEAIAFAASLFAVSYLINSVSLAVRIGAAVALLLVAALAVLTAAAQKKNGAVRCFGRKWRVFPLGACYWMLFVALAFAFVLTLAAMLVSGIAYYAMWALAVGLFLLAVYHTVKIL